MTVFGQINIQKKKIRANHHSWIQNLLEISNNESSWATGVKAGITEQAQKQPLMYVIKWFRQGHQHHATEKGKCSQQMVLGETVYPHVKESGQILPNYYVKKVNSGWINNVKWDLQSMKILEE